MVAVVVADGGNGYTAGPRAVETRDGGGVLALGNSSGMLCGRGSAAEEVGRKQGVELLPPNPGSCPSVSMRVWPLPVRHL